MRSRELGNIETLHPANLVQRVFSSFITDGNSRGHTTYILILCNPFFAECEVAHTRLIFF